MHEVVAYHVCSDCGSDWSILSQKVPFKSEKKRTQWLGVGFYFWPDSNHYAHQWGQSSYKGAYVISKMKLKFPYDELFDLVGNVDHGFKFKDYAEQTKKWLQELGSAKKGNKKLTKIKKTLCVSDVFWMLRKVSLKDASVFPYKLVKAGDFQFASNEIRFVEGKQECMKVAQRIQIVVYPEAKGYIGTPECEFRTKKGKDNERK